jgi:hypothetical protein
MKMDAVGKDADPRKDPEAVRIERYGKRKVLQMAPRDGRIISAARSRL